MRENADKKNSEYGHFLRSEAHKLSKTETLKKASFSQEMVQGLVQQKSFSVTDHFP